MWFGGYAQEDCPCERVRVKRRSLMARQLIVAQWITPM